MTREDIRFKTPGVDRLREAAVGLDLFQRCMQHRHAAEHLRHAYNFALKQIKNTHGRGN